MKTDQVALADAQRRAFNAITEKHHVVMDHEEHKDNKTLTKRGHKHPVTGQEMHSIENEFYCMPKLVTGPTEIIQELSWTGQQQLTFDFSLQGPAHVAGAENNTLLTANNVLSIYGMKLYFGISNMGLNNANGTPYSATTIYYSDSPTAAPGDQGLYNSIIQMKIQTSTLVDKMEGQQYQESNPGTGGLKTYNEQGLVLWNPQRIIMGMTGVQQIIINLKQPLVNPTTNAPLPITPNCILSCRLAGMLGQRLG